MCGPDGMWSTVTNGTKTWSDYSGCSYPEEEEVVRLIKDGDVSSLLLRYASLGSLLLTFAF